LNFRIGFAVILSFALNWQLALIMLLFVPIAFFSGTIAGRANTNTKVKGKYAIEEAGRITTETVENIRTVVSLTREKYFIDEFKKIFDKDFSKTLAVLHVQAIFYSISNVLIFFIQTSAFSFGWMLLKNNSLALTDLYRIYAAMTFSSMTLGRVYAQLPDQTKAKSCSKTVFKIIDRKSKIDSLSEDGIKIDNVIGKIEFKNVNFEYTTRPGVKILNNFNLSVNNGETNALVGPSGCGKSTTISLLLRFYDPTGGEILLDGVDIKKLNIQWLRSQIGIVSQEPILFNYSIFENISNGDTSREKIPIEEIIEAAKQSNIDSRIESLPEVIIIILI
jgi:ABC-type multidrug transport system fused ATPase/permease subunit